MKPHRAQSIMQRFNDWARNMGFIWMILDLARRFLGGLGLVWGADFIGLEFMKRTLPK
jgi:hypothetical protein